MNADPVQLLQSTQQAVAAVPAASLVSVEGGRHAMVTVPERSAGSSSRCRPCSLSQVRQKCQPVDRQAGFPEQAKLRRSRRRAKTPAARQRVTADRVKAFIDSLPPRRPARRKVSRRTVLSPYIRPSAPSPPTPFPLGIYGRFVADVQDAEVRRECPPDRPTRTDPSAFPPVPLRRSDGFGVTVRTVAHRWRACVRGRT